MRGSLAACRKRIRPQPISPISFPASKGVIGIGSPRASLESNFALRALVGPDNFYSGMSGPDHGLVSLIIDILQKGPARTPSLHDVQLADAVLVLGEDLTNTAPLLALSLRQAVRKEAPGISGNAHSRMG